MHIGNHGVLFGPDIVGNLDEIARELRKGGAEGIEIGKRFLGEFGSNELKEKLDREGLTLAAYHMVAMLPSLLDDPASFLREVENASEYLKEYPVKNVLLSAMVMPPVRSDEFYRKEAWDQRLFDDNCLDQLCKTLEKAASLLKDRGVQLHLHNHDWEFLWNGRLMNAYLEKVPSMNIGLDIGWCYCGGWDPVKMFESYPGRITYIHARDLELSDKEKYKTWGERHDHLFSELGEGDLPLKEIFKAFEKATDGKGWVTVEYETGDKSFERYRKASALVAESMK